MQETALLLLAKAAQDASPFDFEPQESQWMAGVLSAVWGGAPGDDMPSSFNQGYQWALRWLSENQPEPAADQSPWQAGTPPGPGWYLVTVEDGFLPPVEVSFWDGGVWRDGDRSVQGIVAYTRLPEPYRGGND